MIDIALILVIISSLYLQGKYYWLCPLLATISVFSVASFIMFIKALVIFIFEKDCPRISKICFPIRQVRKPVN